MFVDKKWWYDEKLVNFLPFKIVLEVVPAFFLYCSFEQTFLNSSLQINA